MQSQGLGVGGPLLKGPVIFPKCQPWKRADPGQKERALVGGGLQVGGWKPSRGALARGPGRAGARRPRGTRGPGPQPGACSRRGANPQTEVRPVSTPGAPGAWRGRAHTVRGAHWPRATQGPGTTDSWESGAEGPAGLRDTDGLVAALLHTRRVGGGKGDRTGRIGRP